ncbi:MAG: hypothetical protein CRN43_20025, partial [Candidatus Nephrothrix sp. EaCA]
ARPDILYRHAELLGRKHVAMGSAKLAEAMKQTVLDLTVPLYLKDLTHDWWQQAKLSDEWLDVVYPMFYKQSGLPQDFYKRDYYQLIALLESDEIHPEITEKLDAIYETLI